MTVSFRTAAILLIASAALLVCEGCLSLSGALAPASEYFTDEMTLSLIRAAVAGDAAAVDDALKRGARLDALGKDGINPLFFVLGARNAAAFELLLSAGADPNWQVPVATNPAHFGKSVVELAAEFDDPKFLQAALSHHGDPNLVDPRTGETPLFVAVNLGRFENIDVLIRYGARIDYQNAKRGRITAMMWAAGVMRYDIVCHLLAAGADPYIPNFGGRTVTTMVTDDLAGRRAIPANRRKWLVQAEEMIRNREQKSAAN